VGAVRFFLAVSSVGILVSFFSATPAAELVFIVLAVAFPFALAALGRGRLTWPVGLAALWFEAAFLAMYALRGHVVDGPWVGGLPLAAAILVYGVFLLPVLFIAWAYAADFELSDHGR
jgi:hypothetical protein